MFRLVNLTGFEETAGSSGLLTVFADQSHSVALLLSILAAWVLIPLTAAARRT